MKQFLAFLFVLIIFSNTVFALPVWLPENEQKSFLGDEVMRVNRPIPQVMSSTGISSFFNYDFSVVGTNSWILQMCQKPEDPAYIEANPGIQNQLSHLPIQAQKGSPELPSGGLINAADQICTNVPFSAVEGDEVKIGFASTLIKIVNGTVEFIVSPSMKQCIGRQCHSDITVTNLNSESFNMSSSDLFVSIPGAITEVSYNGVLASSNITIPVGVNESVLFDIGSLLNEGVTSVKYNVSLWYAGQWNLIDPFFTVGDAPQDISLLPLSNQILVLAYVNGTDSSVYFTKQYANGTVLINPTLVDTVADTHSRVSTAQINDTAWILSWVNGTLGGSGTNFVVAEAFDFDGNSIFPKTAVHGFVDDNTDVSLFALGDRFGFCFANGVDADADIKMYLNDFTQIVSEPTTEFDSNIAPSLTLQNLVSCSAVNSSYFAYVWFDDAAANDATWSRANDTAQDRNVLDLDVNVGETAQVAVTSVNNLSAVFVWYDSNEDNIQIDIAPLSGADTFAPTIIDSAVGGDSRVAVGTVRGQNDGFDSFAVAYFDGGSLKSATYDENGTEITAPFIVSSSVNITLIDVVGLQPVLQNALCSGTYAVGYVSNTGDGIVNYYYLNGSVWDGTCVPFCVENWVADTNVCVSLIELVSYTDSNACGTVTTLPVDNGTFDDCSSFDCEGNTEIPFKSRMEWFCTFPVGSIPNSHNCVSQIKQGDVLIQTNPPPVHIKEYGTVASFREQNHFVNAYFDTENLRRGQQYNYSVTCYNTNSSVGVGTFTQETRPANIRPVFFTDRLLFLMGNSAYIVGAAIMIIILLGGFVVVRRTFAGRIR